MNKRLQTGVSFNARLTPAVALPMGCDNSLAIRAEVGFGPQPGMGREMRTHSHGREPYWISPYQVEHDEEELSFLTSLTGEATGNPS